MQALEKDRHGKSPYRGLLLIPLQLLLSVLIFAGGLLADSVLWSQTDTQGLGHALPVFTALSVPAAIGLFAAVSVAAIVLTAVRVVNQKRNRETKPEG